jgi:hypothetical protein
MGEQLSLEEALYERERKLLYIMGEITGLLNNLHYCRTQITATITSSKAKSHVKYLTKAKKKVNNALEWLSDLDYHVSNEFADMAALKKKEKKWYKERMESDFYVDTAVSSPYAIYNLYIKVYRDAAGLFDNFSDIFEELKPCKRLTELFYEEMQSVGEELEEVL